MAFLLAFLGVACCLPVARAQIVVDRSFGAGGALAPTNGNFDITAGLGRTVGSNLFHSFDQFNINTGQSATFSGPNSIANVISRVTGPNASNIDGTLRSTIPGADVYLINPNGVVFGPNARLDVKGSFAASTADKIRLKDGGVFHASQPSTSSLTSAPPAAFGFLGSAPKALAVHGSQLSVPAGKAVSLVGGDLSVRGGAKVSAPAGRINAVSVASPGEVAIDHSQPSAPIDTSTIATLGNMEILEGSSLDTSDGGLAVDAEGRGGGSVFVRAGRLTMDNGSILSLVQGDANGRGIDVQVTGDMSLTSLSAIDAGARSGGRAGDIFVKADALSLDGQNSTGKVSTRIVTQAASTGTEADGNFVEGTGAAGNLRVEANRLTISNRAFLDTGTLSAGAGGDLTINAADSIQLLSGGQISIVSRGTSTGSSGDLSIAAKKITLFGIDPIGKNQSAIFASAAGAHAPGPVTIDVGNLLVDKGGLISITNNTPDTGNVGKLKIDAGRITVNGSIQANTFGAGNGGNITLRTRTFTVGDTGSITTNTSNAGNGGNLYINVAGTTAIHGKVSADVGKFDDGTDPGVATINLNSTGKGGLLSLTARNIVVAGASSLITADTYSTAGKGLGRGDVFIQASNTVQLRNTGLISADSYGSRRGGNVQVTGSDIILKNSTITADAYDAGHGGDILVQASNALQLNTSNGHNPSYISADTLSSGPGGDVRVLASNISLQNSYISADVGSDGKNNLAVMTNAQSTGPGGKVQIVATNGIQILNAGIISADTYAKGNGGNVNVNSPDVVVSGLGSFISVEAFAQGNAGNLKLTGNNLTVTDLGTVGADTKRGGTGNAGNIVLSLSGSVQLSSGGTIEAIGANRSDGGKAGNLTLNAADMLITGFSQGVRSGIEVDSGRSSKGHGDASIQVGSLTIADRGQISATTFGESDAGDIQLTVSDSLQILSGGKVTGDTTGVGRASDINITAPYVLVSGENNVTGRPSKISSNSDGAGGAGQVMVNTDQLLIDKGGEISTDAGAFADVRSLRGSLIFNVGTGLVDLRSGGVISAQTSGSAAGGSIIMTAGRLNIDGENSQIEATSTGENSVAGKAGRLKITVDGSIALTNGGTITTNASNATGGSINLTTNADLQLSDGASIDAKSVGGGGNVNLDVGDSLIAMNGGISATTTGATAQGGNVTIGDRTHFIILVDTPITARAVGGTGGTITNDADFSFATSQNALAQPPAPEFDPNGLINPRANASKS